MEVEVTNGDIASFNADALITAINSGGLWYGGIDGVIRSVAGKKYHDQASAALPLCHGQTVTARGENDHAGTFKDVVFVIDDLEGPLSQIVKAGLETAQKEGYKSVTLPTIRMGVMLGVVENSTNEAVEEMIRGVKLFQENNPKSDLHVTFVVYNDADTERLLRETIKNNLSE